MQPVYNTPLILITSAREVGHRLTVALVGLAIFLVTYFEQGNLRWAVIDEMGSAGWFFTYILGAMSVIAIIDAVVNDVLSDRYTLKFIMDWRMYFYMLQAALNLSIVYTMFRGGHYSWTAMIYFVMAASSVWIAVFDVLHRYVEPRKQTTQ